MRQAPRGVFLILLEMVTHRELPQPSHVGGFPLWSHLASLYLSVHSDKIPEAISVLLAYPVP